MNKLLHKCNITLSFNLSTNVKHNHLENSEYGIQCTQQFAQGTYMILCLRDILC